MCTHVCTHVLWCTCGTNKASFEELGLCFYLMGAGPLLCLPFCVLCQASWPVRLQLIRQSPTPFLWTPRLVSDTRSGFLWDMGIERRPSGFCSKCFFPLSHLTEPCFWDRPSSSSGWPEICHVAETTCTSAPPSYLPSSKLQVCTWLDETCFIYGSYFSELPFPLSVCNVDLAAAFVTRVNLSSILLVVLGYGTLYSCV